MNREDYNPGPADAQVQKEGDNWALVLVRNLRHSPDKVWQALTDPAQLREWSPFDADKSLAEVGPVTLTTVGAPANADSETQVTRADAPHVLVYLWGGRETRWELEPVDGGTRLTLWASIDRPFIAMGAAGWHICLDVLSQMLDGDPIGRLVAQDALTYGGWQRLNLEYSEKFGVKPVTW